MMGSAARKEDLRVLAARVVTDSLREAVSRSSAAERAARFEECVRSLEAEKAKMEVFRRELPISVHLMADGALARPLVLPFPRRSIGVQFLAEKAAALGSLGCCLTFVWLGFSVQ